MRRQAWVGAVVAAVVVGCLAVVWWPEEHVPSEPTPVLGSDENVVPALKPRPVAARPNTLEHHDVRDAATSAPAGHVSFFVHQAQEPLPDVVITVSSPDREDVDVISDLNGRAELELPEGAWSVVARREGFGASSWSPDFRIAAGGEPLELSIEMVHTIEVSGTVVDEQDRPLAGATINEGVQTPPDGTFRVSMIEGGYLHVWLDGYRPWMWSLDELSRPVRVVLRKLPVIEHPGHVTGIVLDEANEPVSTVYVSCSAPDGGVPIPGAITNTAGRFAVDCPALRGELSTLSGESRPLPVADGDDVVLRIKRDRSLSGRVVDETRKPVTQFSIWESRREEAFATSDGTFHVGGFGARRATVQIRVMRSSVFVTREVDFTGGDVDLGTIVVPTGTKVRGTVVDSSGRGVGGARISGGPLTLTTDAAGRFEFSNDPAKRLELRIMHSKFVAKMFSVDPKVRDVRITLVEEPADDGGFHTDYEGVGMTTSLKPVQAGYRIEALVDDAPAVRAGLRVGDDVIAVDGVPSLEGEVNDFLQRVRGPANTVVMLTIRREGRIFDVRITRRAIQY